MQSVASELLRLIPTITTELIDIPLKLNAKEELAVEQLLEKRAAVLAMIEEEEAALQVALQKANENDAAGALEEKEDGVMERRRR